MLGCCSRHFYCCLCIGSSSRLLEETLQVLSTECPGSQSENTFGFSVWDGEPLFNLPVYRACRYRRRSRPSFRTRPIVNPVYKSKPCRQTCLRTDGASAYVPAAILHIAEHGVMDPYQGLIYFLSYPCACWKHDTPLMHPCQARALFCRVCLMELEHMTRARQSVSEASNQSNLQECLAGCAVALGMQPVDLRQQARCTDSPHGSTIQTLMLYC